MKKLFWSPEIGKIIYEDGSISLTTPPPSMDQESWNHTLYVRIGDICKTHEINLFDSEIFNVYCGVTVGNILNSFYVVPNKNVGETDPAKLYTVIGTVLDKYKILSGKYHKENFISIYYNGYQLGEIEVLDLVIK